MTKAKLSNAAWYLAGQRVSVGAMGSRLRGSDGN